MALEAFDFNLNWATLVEYILGQCRENEKNIIGRLHSIYFGMATMEFTELGPVCGTAVLTNHYFLKQEKICQTIVDKNWKHTSSWKYEHYMYILLVDVQINLNL